jgi:hypothetical protein
VIFILPYTKKNTFQYVNNAKLLLLYSTEVLYITREVTRVYHPCAEIKLSF